MKRIFSGLLVLFLIMGMSACGNPNDDSEDIAADVKEEISRMEEHAVGADKAVSVPTNVDENGEFTDYIDVSVVDSYVETERITKASLDLLQDVVGAFIDDKGNLLDGYSFVGVKLNIDSEKNLDIYTTSFQLRGISNDEYLDAGCFYQDGKRISDDVHDGGTAKLQEGTTEITVGFFAEEEMMKCEKFLLIPVVIDTEASQDNYIEIALKKGN